MKLTFITPLDMFDRFVLGREGLLEMFAESQFNIRPIESLVDETAAIDTFTADDDLSLERLKVIVEKLLVTIEPQEGDYIVILRNGEHFATYTEEEPTTLESCDCDYCCGL